MSFHQNLDVNMKFKDSMGQNFCPYSCGITLEPHFLIKIWCFWSIWWSFMIKLYLNFMWTSRFWWKDITFWQKLGFLKLRMKIWTKCNLLIPLFEKSVYLFRVALFNFIYVLHKYALFHRYQRKVDCSSFVMWRLLAFALQRYFCSGHWQC
jgi:hypothetical protein